MSIGTPVGRRTLAVDRSSLLAGVGGLVFLGLVVVQNILKAATNPSDTASAAQILHFADQEAWSVDLLVVTYVIGFPALFLFAGGLTRRCEQLSTASEPWGRLGRSSVVVIAVLFGLVNALQVVLVAARGDLGGDPALVTTPVWLGRLSVLGAMLLAIAAAPAVAEVHGSNILVVGLIGFLCWLILLAVSGTRLLRLPVDAV